MTDSPLLPKPSPPPSRLDQWVAAFGNAARPFAVYVISASTAVAIMKVAGKVHDGNDGAIYMGAVGIIVVGIYVGKSVENWQAGKQAANVAIAQAQTTS